MIRRLEIDLDALNYRRAFRQILSAGEVQNRAACRTLSRLMASDSAAWVALL